MSRSNKILLGILTFLPMILLIGYLVYFLSFVLGVVSLEHGFVMEEEIMARHILGNAVVMIFLILIMAFLSLGIMIYYIVHANSNVLNDTSKKIMWTLVLIFTSPIGSLVYYFVEILPQNNIKLNG